MFSPDPDSPAFDVVQTATCAEYADVEALELFASDVSVITYEFENIPSSTAMILSARRAVLPDPKVLETTALGAAYLAGLSCGVYKSLDEIHQMRIAQRTIETLRANALTRDDKGKVPPTDTTCSGYVDQRFATNEQSGFAAYGD